MRVREVRPPSCPVYLRRVSVYRAQVNLPFLVHQLDLYPQIFLPHTLERLGDYPVVAYVGPEERNLRKALPVRVSCLCEPFSRLLRVEIYAYAGVIPQHVLGYPRFCGDARPLDQAHYAVPVYRSRKRLPHEWVVEGRFLDVERYVVASELERRPEIREVFQPRHLQRRNALAVGVVELPCLVLR